MEAGLERTLDGAPVDTSSLVGAAVQNRRPGPEVIAPIKGMTAIDRLAEVTVMEVDNDRIVVDPFFSATLQTQ